MLVIKIRRNMRKKQKSWETYAINIDEDHQDKISKNSL